MTPPITAQKVSPEWLAAVLEACGNDRMRLRAHPTEPRLQGWVSGRWGDLMLPGSGFDFTSAEERDIVFARFRTL